MRYLELPVNYTKCVEFAVKSPNGMYQVRFKDGSLKVFMSEDKLVEYLQEKYRKENY